MRFLKFFYPGLRIKRWFFLSFVGTISLFIGAAMASGHWLLLRFELSIRSWAYNHIGVGVAIAPGGNVIWTQIFIKGYFE